MWKVEILGAYKTLFLKDVRKPSILLETFFKMLEIIQWFMATGGASIKKKKKLLNHIQNSTMNQMFVFSQNFYVESLTSNMMLSGDGAFEGNWNWMRSRRWGPHDEIIVFTRKDLRELFLSLLCEIQQELTICKRRGGPSPGTDSVSTLIFFFFSY